MTRKLTAALGLAAAIGATLISAPAMAHDRHSYEHGRRGGCDGHYEAYDNDCHGTWRGAENYHSRGDSYYDGRAYRRYGAYQGAWRNRYGDVCRETRRYGRWVTICE
jgi:uncharacterized membrane protein